MTVTMQASVQYNDWKGTAAADNADFKQLYDILESQGFITSGEDFLVSVHVYIGETRKEKPPYTRITVYLVKAGSFEEAKPIIENGGPLRELDLELSLDEFFAVFKRFNIVFSHRGFDMTSKEYTTT